MPLKPESPSIPNTDTEHAKVAFLPVRTVHAGLYREGSRAKNVVSTTITELLVFHANQIDPLEA